MITPTTLDEVAPMDNRRGEFGETKDVRVRSHAPDKENPQSRKERFEALLTPVLAPLYKQALYLAGNASVADDMVQESILKAWKNFHSFQTGTRFRQWVFQIMTYNFFSELREARCKKRLYKKIQDIGPRVSIANDGWAENPIGQWKSQSYALCEDDIKRAIDLLPDDQRSLLLLVALGNRSYEDAAKFFKVPEGTIMSRLHRARQRLKIELRSKHL